MNILKNSGIGIETFQNCRNWNWNFSKLPELELQLSKAAGIGSGIGIEGFQMTGIGNGIAQSELDPTLTATKLLL